MPFGFGLGRAKQRTAVRLLVPTATNIPSLSTSLAAFSVSSIAYGAGTATLTVTLLDANGIALSASGGTITLEKSTGTSDGTLSAVTDNTNGTYTATWTPTTAGTARSIIVRLDGNALSTIPTITTTPGTIDRTTSTVTCNKTETYVDGTATLTLQAKDGYGNNLTTGGSTVAFGHTGGTSDVSFAAVTDVTDGTYTCVVTGTVEGTATTFTATIGGQSVTTTMPTLTVGITPAFYDDFETGVHSGATGWSENAAGYGWGRISALPRTGITDEAGTGSNGGVQISSTRAHTGTYSLRFRFGACAVGGDASAEQSFHFGEALSEVWIQYYLYIPSDFVYRNDTGTDNNKFLALWRFDYAGDNDFRPRVEYDWYGSEETTPLVGLFYVNDSTHEGTYPGTPDGGYDRYPPFFNISPHTPAGPMAPGNWYRIRYHIKCASAAGANDGVIEFWIDDDKLWYKTGGDFIGPGQVAGTHNTLVNGYVLGWANSGFTDETILYVDEFAVYDTDPGWE